MIFQVKQFIGRPYVDEGINLWLAENPEVIVEHMSLAVTTDQGQVTTVVLICYQLVEQQIIEQQRAPRRPPAKRLVDGVDPAVLFVQVLRQKLEAGDWLFDPMSAENIPARPEGSIMIGWEDELYLYLQTKAVNLIVKEIVQETGRYFVGRYTLYHHLSEKGWLVPNLNQSSVTVWVPAVNNSVRVLKLLRSAVYPEENDQEGISDEPY